MSFFLARYAHSIRISIPSAVSVCWILHTLLTLSSMTSWGSDAGSVRSAVMRDGSQTAWRSISKRHAVPFHRRSECPRRVPDAGLDRFALAKWIWLRVDDVLVGALDMSASGHLQADDTSNATRQRKMQPTQTHLWPIPLDASVHFAWSIACPRIAEIAAVYACWAIRNTAFTEQKLCAAVAQEIQTSVI